MSDQLQEYLDSVRHVPFKWGEHDCAVFVSKWVDLVRGNTLASDHIGAIGCVSALQFRRMQRSSPLAARVREALGAPTEDVPQRGDVVMVNAPTPTLAIAIPPIAIGVGKSGLQPVPLMPVATWRVA